MAPTTPQRPPASNRPAPPQQRPLPESQLPATTSQPANGQLSRDLNDDYFAVFDQTATQARHSLARTANEMGYAVAMARGIARMQDLLSDELMQEILPLMNSELGFLTDRDPARGKKNKQTGEWENVEPYSVQIVRRCLVSAALQGARFVGNEFNIISSKAYLAKAFYRRALLELPGLSNFKPEFAVPKLSEHGALVNCRATWKYKGHEQSLEATIAVKLDGAGADAATGKAERKFFKRVHDLLTGSRLDDGEYDDAQVIDSTATEIRERAEAETAHAAAEGSQEPPEVSEEAADRLANEILQQLDAAETVADLDAMQKRVREAKEQLKATRTSSLMNLITDRYAALEAAARNGGAA